MLESLTIRRIALIDEVTITFHRGMHVLTGETGAGKSIVVDSVNLILGGRADRELIRTGFERASVEAVFDIAGNTAVKAFMDREEIDFDGHSVTVYREITTGGKNICRICGVIFPVSRLKELAGLLMDLHGQSEHQFLTDPERHLSFLDQTGDQEHKRLLRQTRDDYEQFIQNHRAYAKLIRQNENREDRLRSMERDLSELRKAGIKAGEAAALTSKRKDLAEAEKKRDALNEVSGKFSGGESDTTSLAKIREAADLLKKMAVQDENMAEISGRCETLYYELEEIAYQVSVMLDRADFAPGELEKIDDRLDLIHRLERKYGKDADEIPEMLKTMEEEYRELADMEERIARMSAEHKRLLGAYRNTAKELTESRKKLAASFEQRMSGELNQLGMPGTRFSVAFKPNETGRPVMPTPEGDDRIEFMISPNPGEPLKPLARIASGGELSRLMLAIKTLEAAHTGTESMVFDEIDTGISGRMAQVVAEKMITISADRQVICVTHLPQIAAAADYHYLVQKSVSSQRTNTSVTELGPEGRIEEIGRMISGADGITSESKTYAARMLEAAKEQKRNQGQAC